MKKVIVCILLIFLLILIPVLLNFSSPEPLETITDPTEIENLKKEMYLDIVINLKDFKKDQYGQEQLLDAAMRIAKENNFYQETDTPYYREYVKQEDLHQIIKELTNITLNEPISIEDYYYSYDKENQYYYIVPCGTEWIWVNEIKSITKSGDIYTVNYTYSLPYSNETSDSFTGTVKFKLIPDNPHVKYQVIEAKITPYSVAEVYQPYTSFSYGSSELGKELICHSIAPENYQNTILLNFAIHGYEDSYAKDGQLLVDTANSIIEYYQSHIEELNQTRLLIVPCANPDGLVDGTTNNGYGRCNANGVDLNRDFDAAHKVFTSARNKTSKPFSAIESQALRDLVLNETPSIVIDFHGWLNCTIGDKILANVFKEYLNLPHQTEFNNRCNGYFSYWAHLQDANALLVEYKNTDIPLENTIKAITQLTTLPIETSSNL